MGFFEYSDDKDFSNGYRKYKRLLKVPLKELVFRIFLSFIPPVAKPFSKIPVDLVGPILGYVFLSFILTNSYLLKHYSISFEPSKTVLIYSFSLVLLTFFFKQVTSLRLSLLQIISVYGYATYGHIVTLLISYCSCHSSGAFHFFVYMAVLSGLSTLRVALILIGSIRIPVARLLICSVLCVVNILFVIYCNFAFICDYKSKT